VFVPEVEFADGIAGADFEAFCEAEAAACGGTFDAEEALRVAGEFEDSLARAQAEVEGADEGLERAGGGTERGFCGEATVGAEEERASAPDDASAEKTQAPGEEAEGVAEGKEAEVEGGEAHGLGARGDQREDEAEEEERGDGLEGPGCSVYPEGGAGQEQEGEHVGEGDAEITEASGGADAASPADFASLAEAEGVGGRAESDGVGEEGDAFAGAFDIEGEALIFEEEIGDCVETAEGVEVGASESHGCAEADGSAEAMGEDGGGNEFGGEAEGFEAIGECADAAHGVGADDESNVM
jgi:hypothetical protein